MENRSRNGKIRDAAEKLKGSVEQQLIDAHDKGEKSTLIRLPHDTPQEVCAFIARCIRMELGMRAEVLSRNHSTNATPREIEVRDIRRLETVSIRKPHVIRSDL